MSSISSNNDPVMAVPVSLELSYVASNAVVAPLYQSKASYFIAATEEDLNAYPCNLDSELIPKTEYSNGPYTINVIIDSSDQVINFPEYLFETDYGHYCGFTYEQIFTETHSELS